jgi:hypothetical protein
MGIMKTTPLKTLLLTLFVVLTTTGVFGQADVESPYSLFGVGQLMGNPMNVKLKGMGSVGNAVSGGGLINIGNPATLAAMDSLAFLFDAGVYFKTSTFSTSNKSEHGANASFDYVAMAFGITDWWKTALGVQPYSTSGYKMVVSGYSEGMGSYNTVFRGSGGLNQAFWSNAFRIGKHFSIGANAYYVFGDTQNLTTIYPDSTYILGSRRSVDMLVSSFMFDYGLVYNAKLGSDMHLSIGLTYDQSVRLRGKQTLFIRSIMETMDTDVEYLIDTVKYEVDGNAKLTMPQGFGLGFSMQKDNHWTFAADFNWTQWSHFAREGVTESLNDSWRVAAGFEFMPTYSSVSNYFRRAHYRVGANFEHGFLYLNDHYINKVGLTAGISLPLPRSLSKVNLAIEVGQYGTKQDGLIQERYLKFDVGVSVFERWFIKRKYK